MPEFSEKRVPPPSAQNNSCLTGAPIYVYSIYTLTALGFMMKFLKSGVFFSVNPLG